MKLKCLMCLEEIDITFWNAYALEEYSDGAVLLLRHLEASCTTVKGQRIPRQVSAYWWAAVETMQP